MHYSEEILINPTAAANLLFTADHRYNVADAPRNPSKGLLAHGSKVISREVQFYILDFCSALNS